MTRQARVHVEGGIYYLVLLGNDGRKLFLDDQDRRRFSLLVVAAVRAGNARLHGYCWTDRDARLCMEVGERPLGRLVQSFAAEYARGLNRRHGGWGNVFNSRYAAVRLIESADYVRVLRHVHWTPVAAGLAMHPRGYRWSSYPAYEGIEQLERLHTDVAADTGGVEANPAFPYEPGDRSFLASLKPRRVQHPVNVSLDEIIDRVVARLGTDRLAMESPSRARQLSLSRALVAWHAIENGVATLNEVAERLHRHPSSLYVVLRHYREVYPEVFNESLTDLMAGRHALNGAAGKGA